VLDALDDGERSGYLAGRGRRSVGVAKPKKGETELRRFGGLESESEAVWAA